MQHRKIAILGSAPSLVATPREGWEYWSLMSNFQSSTLPVVPDKWFELHNPVHLMKYAGVSQAEIDYLGTMENLYMMNPVGIAKQFPRDEVLGIRQNQYFTSSIAWVIGLAILENVETIGLYGVDLLLTKEYQRERPCIENLLGFAQGRGINIVIPDCSPLMKGALYCDAFAYELQVRAKDNEKAYEKAKRDLAYFEGERDCLESLRYTKG